MNFDGIIESMNKLSQLGVTTILLALLGVLAWYIYKENEERKSKDNLLEKIEDSFDRIATAFEHQSKMYEWMKEEIEHHRSTNIRLKDGIESKITKIGGDVSDIKMAVLNAKFS